MTRMPAIFCAVFMSLLFSPSLYSQQSCPAPALPTINPRANIFSPQQEMDLGDALTEQIQRDFLVIDDPELTGYLQRLGDRLLAPMQGTGMKVRFFLFDLPIANAFSLPGGRIYVSRKMVGFVRGEGELASVLGHELGHVLARQPAIEMTQIFRRVLGVTEVNGRDDIFQKYSVLQDNLVKKRKTLGRSEGKEQQEQLVADQIGMQLTANAGYSPQVFADFFDRFVQTKGKTGSWLTDLFGTTKPESKRLREMVKTAAGLAAPCNARGKREGLGNFPDWRTAVLNYSGLGHKEELPAVLAKVTLRPPLRSDIQRVRFTPDGKFILAQDESTIYVLYREPLGIKFQIDAPEAFPAEFTPDSQDVVFYTPGLRVEDWSIEDEERSGVNELVISKGCQQTALSPDGKVLACYGNEDDLSLYEVATGTPVFQKKEFYEPRSFLAYFGILLLKLRETTNPRILSMHFSPDGHYFLARSPNEAVLALDLTTLRPISVGGSLQRLLQVDFTFLGPDRLLGMDYANPKNSGIVKFPSGEVVDKFPLGERTIEAATNPRYVMVAPLKDFSAGLLDLATKKIVVASKMATLDAFGSTYFRERVDGQMALLTLPDMKEVSRVQLPLGPLGQLRAAALSDDLQWLAISGHSRGGIWNLTTNERVLNVRAFGGAYFGANGDAYVDFDKFEQTERTIGRMDVARRSVDAAFKIGDMHAVQYGSVLVRRTHLGKDEWKSRNMTYEGLEPRSGEVLWKRTFPKEAPEILSRKNAAIMVFSWPANCDGAKTEIRSDSSLSQHWSREGVDADDYFLEAVEARTGERVGGIIVHTGKGAFRLTQVDSAGGWLVAADSTNRLLIYSLSTGEQGGKLFGRKPVVSSGGLLAAQNERGQLSIYNLNAAMKRRQYVLSSPIVFVDFAQDGKRLFVLTANQTAYVFATTEPPAVTAAH